MPPESKPVISSLAEMTCENCVYSAYRKRPDYNEEPYLSCHELMSDKFLDGIRYPQMTFCNKGKWLTSELHYDEAIHGPNPHLADFDTCYHLFGRGK